MIYLTMENSNKMPTLIANERFVLTEIKSATGEKEYYIEGHISTTDPDKYFDIVSNSAQDDILGVYARPNGYINIYQSGSPAINSSEISTGGLPTDAVHIWLHYVAGTGSDSTSELYISANDTKPTAGSAQHTTITGGPQTSGITGIWAYSEYTGSDFLFDKIRVATTPIRNSPL